jgi:hypothetical protein
MTPSEEGGSRPSQQIEGVSYVPSNDTDIDFPPVD